MRWHFWYQFWASRKVRWCCLLIRFDHFPQQLWYALGYFKAMSEVHERVHDDRRFLLCKVAMWWLVLWHVYSHGWRTASKRILNFRLLDRQSSKPQIQNFPHPSRTDVQGRTWSGFQQHFIPGPIPWPRIRLERSHQEVHRHVQPNGLHSQV